MSDDRVAALEQQLEAQRRTIEALMDAVERRDTAANPTAFGVWQQQVSLASIVDRKTRRLRDALGEIREFHRALTEKSRELEQAASFQRAIVDAIDANVCILDEHGVVIETNAYWSAFASQSAEVDAAAHAILAGSDARFVLDYPCEGPDGRWYQVRVSPLPAVDRGRVMIAYLDITALVEAERALAAKSEEAALLALVARHMDSAVLIADPDGRIVWVNESFTTQTGYTVEEAVGRHPAELLQGPEAGPGVAARVEAELRCGRGFSAEITSFTKSGRAYPAELEVRPVFDDLGQLRRVVGISRDITRRLESEARLAHAERFEAIGQLAAGVAHEINTPMQYIGDNLSFLQKAFDLVAPVLADLAGPEPDVAAIIAAVHERRFRFAVEHTPSAIEHAREGVRAVSSIVSAMRAFSHRGALGEKAATDLNACIETTLTVCRNEWKYVAEVETDLAPDLPRVMAEGSALNQVILNLVVNAAHAIGEVVSGDERGRITITSRHDPATEEVVIEVADTGAGVPPAIIDRIFDPFFTTKEVGKGTGQGLTLARSIVVKRHGGSISVTSPPGHGACFTVRLPITEAAPTSPGIVI